MTREYLGVMITVDDSERQLTEVYDRVVGYYRPVNTFNIGQYQYYKDRIRYGEEQFDK